MRIDNGASSPCIHPAVHHGMNVADLVWRKLFPGVDLEITSLHEGTHSTKSLHYGVAGDIRTRAFDIRTRTLPSVAAKKRAVRELKKQLGDAYDVVLEETHIHVEYDPDLP